MILDVKTEQSLLSSHSQQHESDPPPYPIEETHSRCQSRTSPSSHSTVGQLTSSTPSLVQHPLSFGTTPTHAMEDAISLPSTSSTAYHTFTLVVPPAAHRSDSDPVRLSTPEFIPRNAVRAERNFTSPHHSPLLPESRPSITPDYPPGPNLTSFPVTSHTSYQNTPSPYFQTPPMYLANVDYRVPQSCQQGNHDMETIYGPCGIISAVLCFPVGLLALFIDQEKRCRMCSYRSMNAVLG